MERWSNVELVRESLEGLRKRCNFLGADEGWEVVSVFTIPDPTDAKKVLFCAWLKRKLTESSNLLPSITDGDGTDKPEFPMSMGVPTEPGE